MTFVFDVLLFFFRYGPPGTGKTLSARAVANRTDACFIRVIGSELVQKYVGEGARMVRELFQMARSKKACIIFFDEIGALYIFSFYHVTKFYTNLIMFLLIMYFFVRPLPMIVLFFRVPYD